MLRGYCCIKQTLMRVIASVGTRRSVRSEFIMKYCLLLFAVAALCEAGRITRGIDHISHFSNNQAIYHGHGATSYQNVQIDNHDDIVVPSNYGDLAEIQDLEHHESIIPVVDSHYDVHHADISDDSAVYEEFTVADLKLNSDILERYFDRDDDNHNYDVHLEE